MKLPKWLSRELRIHDLNVLLREATRERDLFWRLYQNMSAELVIAQVQRDNARIEIERLTKGVPS